jgi:outer membrane protein TolC
MRQALSSRLKGAGIGAVLVCCGFSFAQTPAVKPQTPDIKVPPPITIPAPGDPNVAAGKAPLSVEEAVAIALRQQATIRAARGSVEAAAGRTQQSRSDLGPQFSASAGVTEQRQLRGSSQGTPNRFSTSVSVDQLLFDFGRTRTAVRQQEALERATGFTLEREIQDVALNTRLFYFDLAEALRQIRTAEDNLSNRQRQLDLAAARVAAGLGSPADEVRAKTNLADGVLALENARQAALDARIFLAEQMGIDPRTPVTPAGEDAPGATPNTDQLLPLVDEALKSRPEIAEAQQRLLAAGLGVAVAKLSNAPSVSLNGSVSSRGADDPLASASGSLAVFLSWRFGDSGFTAGRTKEARALEAQARAGLEDASQRVISEVSRALTGALSARNRVETAQAQVANARELLRISEGRYRGEIGQFLEITDAQNSLFSAERNLNLAISDSNRADARLRRALGRR